MLMELKCELLANQSITIRINLNWQSFWQSLADYTLFIANNQHLSYLLRQIHALSLCVFFMLRVLRNMLISNSIKNQLPVESPVPKHSNGNL